MSIQKINTRTLILISFIVVFAMLRGFSDNFAFLANFTPVGAIALFGGVYFKDKRKAFLVPLITLFISDLVINYARLGTLFYPGMEYMYIAVYLTFALIVLLGTRVKKVNVSNVIILSIGAVFIHWIVTDLGVWLGGTLYPKTAAGFLQCLVAAIPFEKSFLFGTLLYGGVMFGGYEWIKKQLPATALA